MGSSAGRAVGQYSIWGFAAGYFVAYIPYSALTKHISSGHADAEPVPGIELLPVTAIASLVGMFVFLSAMRWWKYATPWHVGSVRLPRPTRWTFLSGICTAAIIATTTLAYTFEGVSIVLMMLVMRGGVLILAPVVDKLSGRTASWYAIVGLVFSIDALVVAFLDQSAAIELTPLAILDVAAYLAAYFIRLRVMSHLAKTDDAAIRTRYFVEEQMVATPLLVTVLLLGAAIDQGAVLHQLRAGFTTFFDRPVVVEAIIIGVCSQATGVFGGLVLLDKRENSYSVPVNRASSILAGVAASYAIMIFLDGAGPSTHELFGAALIVQAILFLTLPVALAKKRS